MDVMRDRIPLDDLIRGFAEAVAMNEGCAYYVGGAVRDLLFDVPTKDLDIEVAGISKETLEILISVFFSEEAVRPEGIPYGIYHLPDFDPEYDIQIGLPRIEKRTGPGHRDLEVSVVPGLSPVAAASRRDFTMNAMRMNILTGRLEDPYGGRADMKNHILRAVDPERFPQDPLRVLRAAEFAARFGLEPDEELIEAGKKADLSTLSRERVEAELRKGLLSDEPSRFFKVLRDMEQEEPWFHELTMLRGIPQDPSFHPEGDVYTHTMMVIDRAAARRTESEDPWRLLFLALTHDFGKMHTTFEKDGRIHAYDHEETLGPAMNFVRRLTDDPELERYLKNMIPLHMKPNQMAMAGSRITKTNHAFDEAMSPRDLLIFAAADRWIAVSEEESERYDLFLEERLRRYESLDPDELITGKDLQEMGIPEGPHYRELLAFARNLWLAETKREGALKQVRAEAGMLLRNPPAKPQQ